jgi:hypothetical protein
MAALSAAAVLTWVLIVAVGAAVVYVCWMAVG